MISDAISITDYTIYDLMTFYRNSRTKSFIWNKAMVKVSSPLFEWHASGKSFTTKVCLRTIPFLLLCHSLDRALYSCIFCVDSLRFMLLPLFCYSIMLISSSYFITPILSAWIQKQAMQCREPAMMESILSFFIFSGYY